MNPLTWIRKHKVKVVSLVFILLFFLLYFADSMFVYVYPGQQAVLFRSLSEEPVSGQGYAEGLYLVAPWNRMMVYDTTTQKQSVDIQALSSSGLRVMLQVTAVYHPDAEKLRTIALSYGPDYVDKILIPILKASVRETIGNYLPEDLYTTARNVIQDKILEESQREVEGLPFVIEDIIIEELKLPDSINQAIENKLKHQQDALAYTYILEQEVAEASRRSIEAKSIKLYQAEVGSNLTEDILRWLEIRALSDLSRSPNSKIIVLGNGNGSPLVLPTDD